MAAKCTVGSRDQSATRDALLFFVAAFVVYWFTCPGATGYDQYSLFADTLIHGHLSLPQRPPHLEMAEFQGRAYFTNPPTPTIVLVPFIWIGEHEPFKSWLIKLNGGWAFPFGWYQTGLSLVLGALNVALARVGLGRAPLSRRAANWGAALFGFGSIVWYHSTIGSVWYLAQITHATAMWLLVIEWLGKQRPLLMGLWLAAAFWSRMETLVATPFLLVLTLDKWLVPRVDELIPRLRIGWLLKLAAPVAVVLVLEFTYNYVRYGTFENYGYRMLIEKPEVRGMFPYGLLSWHYFWNHVQVMFQSVPIMEKQFPWVMPKVSGTAIWITTPAFVWAFLAPWDRLTAACWLGIVLFIGILFQHCGTGMTQLGYRFAMDFYPLLVLLTMRGMDRPRLRPWGCAFIVVSIAINAWAVYTLNILGIGRLF